MKKIKFEYPVDTTLECVHDNWETTLPDYIKGNPSIDLNDRKLPVIRPEDFEGATIGAKVIAMNNFVLAAGGGFEMYFGNTSTYLITQAIVLPSNTTVRIVDCTIQLADNTVDNMFRTANIVIDPEHPYGFALNKDDMPPVYNVRIIGEQNPVLLMVNNTSQYGESTVGWRGHTIEFVGVSNFEIAGFKTEKNIAWQIALTGCSFGSVHDIEFHSTRDNGDGIDVEFGSHDIEIYNITGECSDDAIAVSNSGPSRLVQRPVELTRPTNPMDYGYRKFGEDTYNIRIYNAHVKNLADVVDIICGDYGIHHVSIADISDNNGTSQGATWACVVVFGGQYDGGYHHGLIHDVYISGVSAYACGKAAIYLNGGVIQNCQINDVKLAEGQTLLLNESGIDPADYNFTITNTGTIE